MESISVLPGSLAFEDFQSPDAEMFVQSTEKVVSDTISVCDRACIVRE